MSRTGFFRNSNASRTWRRRRAGISRARGHAAGRRNSAFSLVELLMVMAIMLILAAIVAARFRESQRAALEGAVVQTLKTIHANQETYRYVNKTYTADFKELNVVGDGATSSLRGGELPAAVILPPALTELLAANEQVEQDPDQQSTGSGKTKKGGKGGGISGPIGGASGGGQGKRPGKGGAGAGGGQGGPPPSGGGSSSGGTGTQPPSGGGSSGGTQTTPPSGGTGGSGGSSGSGSGSTPTSSRCTSGSSCNQLTKHKYIFTLELVGTDAWRCSVEPVMDRLSSNFFYTDNTGTIRREFGKAATAQSKAL